MIWPIVASAYQVRRAMPTARANPFVQMSQLTRTAVLFYFVLWEIFPELMLAVRRESDISSVVVAIFFLKFMTTLLAMLPFLVRRLGGLPIGWLHPLVLPAMLLIAQALATDLTHFVKPIQAFYGSIEPPRSWLFRGMTNGAVHRLELKREAIFFLATLCYYAGFLLYFKRTGPDFKRALMKPSQLVFALGFGFILLVFLVFLQLNGGLVRHMTGLAFGRFDMRETSGHFLVVIKFAPYLLVLWYLYRPKILLTPWFLGALALAVAIQFVATGSRSSIILPIAVLGCAWMLVNWRVPVLTVVTMVVLAALSLGVLKEVRNSGREAGQVDFSQLMNFDFAEKIFGKPKK